MDQKIKELLIHLSFFAADGMGEEKLVEFAKQADALLMEVARKPNTHQPVAWIERYVGGGVAYDKYSDAVINLPEGVKIELYTAPPVQRDVLMAFGEAVKAACGKAWGLADECDEGDAIRDCDITAIADRYASKVQPEPVNQQILADLHGKVSKLEEELTAAAEWRRLALQFDNHRIEAIAHLRCLLESPESHATAASRFLCAPPLSGEQVLAERIAAIAAAEADAEDNKESGEIDRVVKRLESSDPDFDDCNDAVVLLRKYKKLCREIGRGDSYHLGRIDSAIHGLNAKQPAIAQPVAVPDVVEQIAKQWDECMYDSADGCHIDIGEAIRSAGNRLSAAKKQDGGE